MTIRRLTTLLLSASLGLNVAFSPTIGRSKIPIHDRQLAQIRPEYSNSLHAVRFDNDAQEMDDDLTSRPIRRRHRFYRYVKKSLLTVALATSVWSRFSAPAQAKFSYELRDDKTHSLRPGMSRDQAVSLEDGKLDVKEIESRSIFSNTPVTAPASAPLRATAKKAKKTDFVYSDEDDEDYLEEEDVVNQGTVGSQSDQVIARRLKQQTARQFATYQPPKNSHLRAKVAIAIFVPTFGAQIVREYVRRRREETYVQKGLEIQRAQYAEYFNVTSTSDDTDVSDELKGLKKNSTKSKKDDDDDNDDGDDDDDDDADEDDDKDIPRGRRRSPRNDGGGGNGGPGDSGSDGGNGSDYKGPSDEELDRLNRLYGKS